MAELFWKWVAGRNARAVCLLMAAIFLAAVLLELRSNSSALPHEYMSAVPSADVADRLHPFRVRRATDADNPFVSAYLNRLEAERLRRETEAMRRAEQERLRREAEEKARAEKAAARAAAQPKPAPKPVPKPAPKPAPKPVPKPAPKPKPKPKPKPVVLTYRGMMKQTDGVVVAVLFDQKSRTESVLSVGEEIAGCKVKAVGRDNVTLIRGDGTNLVLQVAVPMNMGQ